MSEFINFFRKASKHLDKKTPANKPSTSEKKSTPPPTAEKKSAKKEIDTAKELINKYRAQYADVDLDVLRNMIELKDITSQPKTEQPDNSLKEIKKRLGDPETGETLRQERWDKKVTCPYCKSDKIKKLAAEEQKSAHIYKYNCLNCHENFDDDSETEMEGGVPPLYTWMLCWYLFGCTNSLQYIASKLGLDVGTVELMIQYMQKLFKSEQPLTNFLTFDEWSLKYGKSYKSIMQDSLTKKEVLFGLDTAKTPGDTAEYRKQKNRGPKLKPRS